MIKYIIVGFLWSLLSLSNSLGQSLNDLVGAKSPPTVQQGVVPMASPTPPVAPVVVAPVAVNAEVINLMVKETIAQSLNGDIAFKMDPLPGEVSCQTPLKDPEISILTVNDQQTKFSGELKFCAESTAQPVLFQGTLDLVATVPVLSRSVHFGETITEKDLTTLQVSARKVNKQMITQMSELIGTQPRDNTLRPQTPITRRQVIRPHDVKKDSYVTISYIKPHMVLATKGKALKDGYRGEIIPVENLDSKKTIKATIEGMGHVFVDTMPDMQGATPPKAPETELLKEISHEED